MSIPEMTYSPLGKCGMKVSKFSLGGWTTYGDSVRDGNLVKDIIHAAFDAGANFFDIADIYGRGETEKAMGKVFKDFARHELVISSKVFAPMSDDINDRGLSRKHILESVEKSLRRIGTDYLDIYFCHRYDKTTPLEETVRAMDDLVHQGKVLYWGTSEWSADNLREAHELCDRHNYYRPQVEQPQYNILQRRIETEILPVTDATGMGVVVWSPLASGILSGKYDNGIPEASRLARIDWLRESIFKEQLVSFATDLKPVAAELGCTRAQLALAWAAANPGVSSVITGATSVEQVKENLGALAVEVDDEIKAKIDALMPPPPDNTD